MDHLLRASFDRDWLSLILMGTLACIAILRYFFPRRMSELILLPLNDQYFSIEPHQRGYLNPFNTVLLGLQIIAFGLVEVVFNIIIIVNKSWCKWFTLIF